MIAVGEILKPQGISGELKVRSLAESTDRFYEFGTVYIRGRKFCTESLSVREGFVYLRLSGVNTRNAAEELRGALIEIPNSEAAGLEEGSYYISDVLGSDVLLGGENIGRVSEISNFGAADVYTVKGAKTVRFPFLKKLFLKVDTAGKFIVLDPKVFSEVAVYED